MKKIFAEFKEFIMRGNVLDMAVGVIIGAAFKAIVDSLTNDIISPILGVFGGIDFSSLVLDIGTVELKYGSFITSIINFLIMAVIIFFFIKGINGLMNITHLVHEETPAEPTTKKCPYCVTEIDVNATRCPNCTSELEDILISTEEIIIETAK